MQELPRSGQRPLGAGKEYETEKHMSIESTKEVRIHMEGGEETAWLIPAWIGIRFEWRCWRNEDFLKARARYGTAIWAKGSANA